MLIRLRRFGSLYIPSPYAGITKPGYMAIYVDNEEIALIDDAQPLLEFFILKTRKCCFQASLLVCLSLCISMPVSAQNSALPENPPYAALNLSAQEIAWLKQHPVIRLGVDPGYAPYAFIDTLGRYQGVSADFVDYISLQLGIQLQVIPNLKWPQILKMAEERTLDVITTVAHLPERERFLNFSQIYIPTPLVIMTRTDNSHVQTPETLRNQHVALVKGYSSSERVLKEYGHIPMRLTLVDNPLQGLRAVSSGAVDAYVGVLGVNTYLASENGISNLKVAGAYDMENNGQRFGVRRDWPEFVSIIDKVLNAMPEDQKLAIFRKWIAVEISPQISNKIIFTEEEKRWIAAHPKLRIGISPHDEPIEFTDKTGAVSGLAAEYLERIKHATGLIFEHHIEANCARRLELTKEGALDLTVAMSAIPERWPNLDFSIPFYISDLMIFGNKKGEYLSGISELAGKKVAVQDASTAHELLRQFPLVHVEILHSTRELLQAVANSRVDAAITEVAAGLYIIEKLHLNQVRPMAPISEQRIAFRFAINNDHPELQRIINKVFATISPTEASSIRRHWLGVPITRGLSPQIVMWWAVGIGSLVLVGFGLFYTWNRRLTLIVNERTAGLSHAIDCLNQEVAARQRAQEDLYQEKELAQITLTSIGDAVISTDQAGQIRFMNAVAERLTGWPQKEAIGQALPDVFKVMDESNRQLLESWLQQCIVQKEVFVKPGHSVLIARDGSEHPIEHTAAPIFAKDKSVLGIVLVFQDVSHNRALNAKLSYQAKHDALTGLLNRNAFDGQLEAALESARTTHVHHALLYLDMDQFKVVNDTCGHQAGDELLRQLATLMRMPLRERDTLARLGGDEFGILLEGCPIEMANNIGNDIRKAIESHRFKWQERIFRISASIGVVSVDPHSESAIALLSAADMACFAAKDAGRNRVHITQANDQIIRSRSDEMQWLPRLEQAIQENQFVLYYQRIIPLQATATVQHFEILLRLKDVNGGLTAPGAFIPAAERYGLMSQIDRWVIRQVFLCKQQITTEANTLCCINLSGQSLTDPTLIDYILDLAQQQHIDANTICFEITETAAITNLAEAGRLIDRLTEAGYHFSLDDFGSGLSSFPYLKNLSVNYLKIDGSFVCDMTRDPVNYTMVESITRIGQVMGMRTIAEFVQDETTLIALRNMGVDYAQGFHVHRPEPIDQFEAQ